MNTKTYDYIKKYSEFTSSKNCIMQNVHFDELARNNKWLAKDVPTDLVSLVHIGFYLAEEQLNAIIMMRPSEGTIIIHFNKNFCKADQITN